MPIANTPITNNTPLIDLITYSQTEIRNLLVGEEFMVKDLFLGYEWNRIDKGNRTRLGSSFFAFAQGAGAAQIVPLGKTPQNQQRYRRI
ncbi:DUF1413 domain-containing protein [Desulfocucumis palustris]|uniref:DUF1413 domain-containing protein n=1 Tax=Desulfocucumis palustris TaxID=1898651 RepID=UPI000CEA657F|nr:DUF1413 domain-containing protein [Desulfocucumis palustris]